MSSLSLESVMKRLFLFVCALLLAVSLVPARAEKVDQFAECLAKSGAVMWSAWWCPHCLRQLQAIDPSVTREDMQNTEKLRQKFPFVTECADHTTGKANGACPNNLRGVPTWGFKDGSRLSGAQPLETLSAKTECALPEKTK